MPHIVGIQKGDDMWHQRKLERQIALFACSEIGLVHSGLAYVDAQGRMLGINVSGQPTITRLIAHSTHRDHFVHAIVITRSRAS